ncbi:CAP domain-containing protein [Microvirga lotononidis]|uniref:Putative calcium-binding protein n=1 Tax=Microvirga lotononidis TaxID=864069 RepID=I4Z2T0_9HYPH|nr:CAP domain-containing protein [Microvirga lotononidis]EIM30522.1 putative calcium-binding protein [Microvirga lotononidis]WQO26355.1 CAP domain-containing protein [Microvirga lotononidis]
MGQKVRVPSSTEAYFLQLVNEARATAGIRPLMVDSELMYAADYHNQWMDSTDTVSHTGWNGSGAGDRLTNHGYAWQDNGENVAYLNGALSEATARQLFDDLMRSPEGRDNILNGSFEETGIVLGQGTLDGKSVVFLTQAFAKPTEAERAEAYDKVGSYLGTEGDDVIRGSDGVDVMYGGAGNDVYYMNNVNDRIGERVGEGYDHIYSSVGAYMANEQVERITLTGSADVSATGNNLNNRITGNAGANYIYGSGGNDILNGKGGKDILSGGKGSDTFVFDSAEEANGDTIDDFGAYGDPYTLQGRDKIDLSAIDANAKITGNQAFTFIGTERFHNVPGELHYYHPGVVYGRNWGDTYISGDTNGDGKADFAIKLPGWQMPSADDFVL